MSDVSPRNRPKLFQLWEEFRADAVFFEKGSLEAGSFSPLGTRNSSWDSFSAKLSLRLLPDDHSCDQSGFSRLKWPVSHLSWAAVYFVCVFDTLPEKNLGAKNRSWGIFFEKAYILISDIQIWFVVLMLVLSENCIRFLMSWERPNREHVDGEFEWWKSDLIRAGWHPPTKTASTGCVILLRSWQNAVDTLIYEDGRGVSSKRFPDVATQSLKHVLGRPCSSEAYFPWVWSWSWQISASLHRWRCQTAFLHSFDVSRKRQLEIGEFSSIRTRNVLLFSITWELLLGKGIDTSDEMNCTARRVQEF